MCSISFYKFSNKKWILHILSSNYQLSIINSYHTQYVKKIESNLWKNDFLSNEIIKIKVILSKLAFQLSSATERIEQLLIYI